MPMISDDYIRQHPCELLWGVSGEETGGAVRKLGVLIPPGGVENILDTQTTDHATVTFVAVGGIIQ